MEDAHATTEEETMLAWEGEAENFTSEEIRAVGESQDITPSKTACCSDTIEKFGEPEQG